MGGERTKDGEERGERRGRNKVKEQSGWGKRQEFVKRKWGWTREMEKREGRESGRSEQT